MAFQMFNSLVSLERSVDYNYVAVSRVYRNTSMGYYGNFIFPLCLPYLRLRLPFVIYTASQFRYTK